MDAAMTPPELCHEAARRGLRLEPRGDKLAVIPASRCPPEFADTLRQPSKATKRGTKGDRSEQQRRYRARHPSKVRDYMRRYMAARRASTLLT